MKLNIILSIIIALLVTTSCENKQKTPSVSSLENYVDSLFKESIDSAEIAGAAVLVYQKNQMLLNKSYGKAFLELSVPMPTDGQFEVGSVTKQFTAVAILKLVEAEKLSLDDDFTDYLSFDTRGRKITINNLLNHTSGIPSYTEIPAFRDLSIEEHPRDSLVRLVEQNEFLFEPNEALFYNNSGYFFLGLIIEKVTGQSYGEFLQQKLFEPLGMHNTRLCSTTEVVNKKVYGYNYTPEGLQQKSYISHTWPYSAGSLCSTTGDLLTWMKALHTGKVLSEPMYLSLISPGQLNDGTNVRYAKGFWNFSNFGHREISHGGAIPGFLAYTQYFPDEDLYIIILLNTMGRKEGKLFVDIFKENITWNLLEKKPYKQKELDVDTAAIQGEYNGVVPYYPQSVKVKCIKNGITVQSEGKEKIDTLSLYIGNNTWMEGNHIIVIENNEYRVDNLLDYYVLKKEK